MTFREMLAFRNGRRALAFIVLVPLAYFLAGSLAWGAEHRQREGVDEVVYQVNVNEASSDQLQLLYRVGPVLAGRIIEEREASGPFTDLADLQGRVKGIGARLIACNADFISFAGETDLQAEIACAD